MAALRLPGANNAVKMHKNNGSLPETTQEFDSWKPLLVSHGERSYIWLLETPLESLNCMKSGRASAVATTKNWQIYT